MQDGVTRVGNRYRARKVNGHTAYHRKLIKKLQGKIAERDKAEGDLRAYIAKDVYEIEKQIESHRPKIKEVRRNEMFADKEAAEYAMGLFNQAYRFESENTPLPQDLIEELEQIEHLPSKVGYLEETSYLVAKAHSFSRSILKQTTEENKSAFIQKSLKLCKQIKTKILYEVYKIKPTEIYDKAYKICDSNTDVVLKGKTFIYTGAFSIGNIDQKYIKCLMAIGEDLKIEGIILNGPWKRDKITNFDYYSDEDAPQSKIPSIISSLAKKFKVYALRSSIDDIPLTVELKNVGIEFINGIEDDKNLFFGDPLSKASNKGQMAPFKDFSTKKNVFAYSTYVHLEKVMGKNFVLGCGSSSPFVPSSNMSTVAVNSSIFKARKYDDIGGFVLRFDKEGDVFPSNFKYNEDIESIFVNGKVYKHDGTINKAELHLVVSDVHGPLVHERAYASLLKFTGKHRFKSVILLGDFFDNSSLCHFDENKTRTQVKKAGKGDFFDEVFYTKQLLDKLIESASGAKFYFKFGNHENSSLSKFLEKSLVHNLSRCLDLDMLLDISGRGIVSIDCKTKFTLGKGQLDFWHGDEIARSALSKNCVKGHYHRPEINNYGTSLPCLQDQATAGYLKNTEKTWSMGWCVVPTFEGAVGSPELILINNDKYFDYTEIKEIEESLDIERKGNLNLIIVSNKEDPTQCDVDIE